MTAGDGYWPSPWPGEDGGPARTAAPRSGPGLGLAPGERLESHSRPAMAATMVVLREPGEVYLLRHTAPPDAVAAVELIDPVTLEPRGTSPDLPGGPAWPGGLAAHAGGSLHVVFGNHVHRLSADLEVLASRTLPRERPYNSFVVLPSGHLVTKDFAGPYPGHGPDDLARPSELLVLDPEDLTTVACWELPEPVIARLSLRGNEVVVPGTESLLRVGFDGERLELSGPPARYRTLEGQGAAWDAVIDGDRAWFLDNGNGTDRYAGTLRGIGVATVPLHLVRVDLDGGRVHMVEVSGTTGGIIANPPAVDTRRQIVVGYDSGNGEVAAFDADGFMLLWSTELDHASHPLFYPDTGELVLCDHRADAGREDVIVLDITTGDERGRVTTGSDVQSVLFPAAGFGRDFYLCSFTTLSRVWVA